MGRTYKHQDTYNFLNDRKQLIPTVRFKKLLKYFNRVNFWDWDIKIMYRKHKDYIRGGKSRIKGKKYR